MNYLPLPIPGESPLSVVLRCTEENGYSSASKFIYRLIKSPAQSVLFRSGHFAKKIVELIAVQNSRSCSYGVLN